MTLALAGLPELALILGSSDCELRSVMKFFNAQSIAPIKIHQLCQVYGHTWLDGQHISCRSSTGRCLIIIYPIARILRPGISIFPYTSRNSFPVSISVFKMTESRKWVSQWFQSQAAEIYDTGYKNWSRGMTDVSIPKVNMLKNISTLNVYNKSFQPSEVAPW